MRKNNNVKVSDFLALINTVLEEAVSGIILDPSEVFLSAIIPKKNGVDRKNSDFKDIYCCDLFEPDVEILKMNAKYFDATEYKLPTVKDFIDLVEQNRNVDLNPYEICICCEDEDGDSTIYHLGEVVRVDYHMIADNPYITILLERSINQNPTIREMETLNTIQKMGVLS